MEAEYAFQVEKVGKLQELLAEEVENHEATKVMLQASETSKFKLLLQASRTTTDHFAYDSHDETTYSPPESPAHDDRGVARREEERCDHNPRLREENTLQAGDKIDREIERQPQIRSNQTEACEAISISRGEEKETTTDITYFRSEQEEQEERKEVQRCQFRDRFEQLERPNREESGLGWWRWSASTILASPPPSNTTTTANQRVGSRLVLRV